MTAPRTPPAPRCAACGCPASAHDLDGCGLCMARCRRYRAPASPSSASPEGEPPCATVEPSVVREACMDVVGDDAVPPGEAWIEDKRTGRIIGKVTGLTAPAPSPSSGGSAETASGEVACFDCGVHRATIAHLQASARLMEGENIQLRANVDAAVRAARDSFVTATEHVEASAADAALGRALLAALATVPNRETLALDVFRDEEDSRVDATVFDGIGGGRNDATRALDAALRAVQEER